MSITINHQTNDLSIVGGGAPTLGGATYRQALRDITVQSGFPYDVVWPTKP
jgi:hypothetical protein